MSGHSGHEKKMGSYFVLLEVLFNTIVILQEYTMQRKVKNYYLVSLWYRLIMA